MTASEDKLLQKVLILGAGYFLVVAPILKKLGILKSNVDQQADVIETGDDSPFSPLWQKKIKQNHQLFTRAANLTFVNRLRKALTGIVWMNDDEEAVYAIFKAFPSQAHVSHFAQIYAEITGKNLFSWLRNELSESELSTVIQIVNKKPKYITVKKK